MPNIIGRELSGYRILEQIGKGGMAKVYKAYQPSMDRVVALKLIPDIDPEDDVSLKRFRQEAKIIAQLEHPHIIPVHDFGEVNEFAFLVMRYLQAGNLKDLLAAAPGGKFSLSDAALLIQQIGSALDYTHENGIVHRDVKPANILIGTDGQAFLTDYGIAKVLEGSQQLTKFGATLGTPAYMSPEQAAAKEIDLRSDIYSLGIILYEMLTGIPPYDSETPLSTMYSLINDPLPLPSSINPDIPEVVELVILKALAKEPRDRFQSAGELSKTLLASLADLGEQVIDHKFSNHVLEISSSVAENKPSENLTIDDREVIKNITQRRRRKRLLPWGIGILLLSAITGIIIQLNKRTATNLAHQQSTIEAFELIINSTSTQTVQNRIATQAVSADGGFLLDNLIPVEQIVTEETFQNYQNLPFSIIGDYKIKDGLLTLQDKAVSENPWADGEAQMGHGSYHPKPGNGTVLLFQIDEVAATEQSNWGVIYETGPWGTDQFMAIWYQSNGWQLYNGDNNNNNSNPYMVNEADFQLEPNIWYYLFFRMHSNGIVESLVWPQGFPEYASHFFTEVEDTWIRNDFSYNVHVPEGIVKIDTFLEFELATDDLITLPLEE